MIASQQQTKQFNNSCVRSTWILLSLLLWFYFRNSDMQHGRDAVDSTTANVVWFSIGEPLLSSPAVSSITLLASRAKTCIFGQCLPAVRQLTLKQVLEKSPNPKNSHLDSTYWFLNGQLGKRNQGFTGLCRMKRAQNSRNSFGGWFSLRLGKTNLYS